MLEIVDLLAPCYGLASAADDGELAGGELGMIVFQAREHMAIDIEVIWIELSPSSTCTRFGEKPRSIAQDAKKCRRAQPILRLAIGADEPRRGLQRIKAATGDFGMVLDPAVAVWEDETSHNTFLCQKTRVLPTIRHLERAKAVMFRDKLGWTNPGWCGAEESASLHA